MTPSQPDHDRHSDNGTFVAGLAIGALVGAGTAYLVKSDNQDELKKELKTRGKLLLARLNELGDEGADLKDKITSVLSAETQQISQKVLDTVTTVKDTIEDYATSSPTAPEAKKTSSRTTHRFFKRKK